MNTKPSTFGSPLLELDQSSVSTAEKEWLRVIIGAEILELDSVTRTAFLQDSVYGKELVAATSIAQATRSKQLDSVWQAAVQGESRFEIDIGEVVHYVPAERNRDTWAVSLNVVKGKTMWLWSTDGATFFVTAGKDDFKPPVDFNPETIARWLADKKARIFVAAPGGERVFEVKDRSMAHLPPK